MHKASKVDAPIIDEYPLTLECEVVEMQEVEGDFRIVGQIVNTVADESILGDGGNIDLGKLRPISYDSSAKAYRVLGDIVGNAFHDGASIKSK